ncbi:uncharacterized protein [Linepithema humile]|uniref:uncharacterized protein isoform X5 n=1 Tax=Linepithema humile TaxID=83485 RepID=UPI00351F7AED
MFAVTARKTRQSSGAVGNDADEKEGSSLDCSPRRPTPMTMATATSMTPTALPGSPGSSIVCPATDIAINLQHRRRLQLQQPQELSLTQTMRAATDAASSSSTYEEPSRTPLSGNVLLSLPASPKRSSASHFSSSKTPAISKSQMKGDGNVSFEEFVEIVSNIGASTAAPSDQHQEEQELRDAFRVFDKHNRGYITASDLRAVLQCLGEDLSEEEIEDMIKEVDVDGDGRIDFYEFVHALGEPGIDEDEEDDEEDLQSPLF